MLTADAHSSDMPCNEDQELLPPREFQSQSFVGRPGAEVRSSLKAMRRASEHYQVGDLEKFYETLTVLAFRNSRISVTLANPALPDCPLVGVSQGFEHMTGYSQSTEIIGRNCRFLNRGCPMPAEVRHQMRLACRTDTWFRGILVNRRKNGELFQNLLHMCWMKVGNSLYILGLQADVTNTDVDLSIKEHMEELDRLVDAIFAANVDAWAALQATNFGAAKLGVFAPYTQTELVPRVKQGDYEEARDTFVLLAPGDEQGGVRLRYSNTFIEVDNADGPGTLQARLRRVSSAPALGSKEAAEAPRLSPDILRDTLGQFSGAPLTGLIAPAVQKPELDPEAAEELELRSQGSALHPYACTPCSFHCYSQMGCNRGQSCTYCHMDHRKRTRRRGKKKPKKGEEGKADASGDLGDEDSAPVLRSRAVEALPSPTPAGLQPLLDALELLSPLPGTALEASLRAGGAPLPAAARATEAEEAGKVGGGRAILSIWYSEDTVVLARGQWKQVIPFVRGTPRPLTFAVSPLLPLGLSLRRHSGVITGVATQLTPAEGVLHTVTAEGEAGKASTLIHVLVVDRAPRVQLPGSAGSGAGSSDEE